MAVDAATRRERDLALLVQAAAHNSTGIAELDRAAPGPMADLRQQDQDRRSTAHSATEGPWLLGVRDLARVLSIVPAQRAFQRADQCYWALVMHWRPMIQRMAKFDEIKYHLPMGELQGMYSEIAYHVAIRLDLDRAVFGTYFQAWRRSFIGRAPELQSLVHGSASALGLNARMALRSFDEPVPEDRPMANRELTEALALDDSRFDDLDLHAASQKIQARLTERDLGLFRLFCEYDKNTDAGEVLGVSRERARQLRNAVITKGAAIVYERVSP